MLGDFFSKPRLVTLFVGKEAASDLFYLRNFVNQSSLCIEMKICSSFFCIFRAGKK
jgi:hypothetical protein